MAEAHDGPNMTIAANDVKPSISKTGVHLCYHKHHECKKLTHEQRHELSEWRQNNPDTHKPSHVKKPHATGGGGGGGGGGHQVQTNLDACGTTGGH